MKKIISFSAPLLVLLGAVAVTMGLSATKPTPDKTDEPPRALSLYVEPVRADRLILEVETQGEVRAKTMIDLVPEVGGRIVMVADAFSEGGSFGAGETLVKIDDRNYRLAVTRAEARVAEARVTLEQELADARIKKKQWEDWVHEGEPTPLALNQPQVAQAQAAMRAAEADLEDARINLERTEIKLPFTGRVSERMVGVGQFVNAGAQLGRVFATDVVEVKLPLTDKQLAELAMPVGFVANGTEAPQVTFSAQIGNSSHSWLGEIKRINASVDQQTRLYYAIAEVSDPYGVNVSAEGMPMAVGLFVNAAIEGVQPTDALILPRIALRGEDKVYVVENGELLIKTVDILASDDNRLLLSKGVEAGALVVTSPVRSAYDGMAVEAITRSADSSENQVTAVSANSR